MKIETKYDIGQEVWFMNHNKCESSVVKGMKIACVNGNYLGYINHVSIDYSLEEGGIYPECYLFPTKEELHRVVAWCKLSDIKPYKEETK